MSTRVVFLCIKAVSPSPVLARANGPVPGRAISYVHPPAHTIPFLAATASMLGVVVTYPMALIRSKMQASFYWKQPLHAGGNPHPKLTLPSLLSAIWRDDGVIGLYRGMGANLVKVLPATAISMLTYESIRRKCNLGPMGSG
nr:unnamed protein product [Spirometra erinaceieuropaei]